MNVLLAMTLCAAQPSDVEARAAISLAMAARERGQSVVIVVVSPSATTAKAAPARCGSECDCTAENHCGCYNGERCTCCDVKNVSLKSNYQQGYTQQAMDCSNGVCRPVTQSSYQQAPVYKQTM